MTTDRIRKIRYRGYAFWQHEGFLGWELEPVRFIRRFLKSRRFKPREIEVLLADTVAVDARPNVLLTRLHYNGKTLGFRAHTWVGPRCASEQQIVKWLRRNEYAKDEIDSLLTVADEMPVSKANLKAIRSAIASGIQL